jgi:hypothetical protein
METAIVIIGVSAVTLLWLFAAIGGIASLWETFGDHVHALIERVKR